MKSKLQVTAALLISCVVTISIVAAVNAGSIQAPARSTSQSLNIQKPDQSFRPSVIQAEQHDTSPALRDLARLSAQSVATTSRTIPNLPLPRTGNTHQPASAQSIDRVLQTQAPQAGSINLINNFEGINNIDGVYPPDTEGDIGYDPATNKKYYIQWVNLHYAIWDVTVTPTLVVGPLAGNTLWSGFGGACATTNDGDPIALYDPIAHRWLMSQFSVDNPYYQCIAISTTGDPTGSWYRYSFRWRDGNGIDTFNDYGKFGVWPDGYYFTANQFSNNPDEGEAAHQPNAPRAAAAYKGAGAAVFERDRMLNGQSASMIYFDLNSIDPTLGGMLPADFDGTYLPPANSPDYFVEVDDSALSGVSVTTDSLRLWKFHADWTTPLNSTFGVNGAANYTLTVASYNSLPCVSSLIAPQSCIPQPVTSVKLDAVADRLMYRLGYRNFGDHEALVVNHTVKADSIDRAGVRWYEVRGLSGSPSIYQQGTFAPNDGLYRWMGSAAMDHTGDLALGYSVASASVYPSIRVTGRLVSDTLGILPQGETTVITGTGYQDGVYQRWGDYSTMSIDPVDDCTFWYTQEYIQTSGSVNWQTRIASFKFPGCTFAAGWLIGTITDSVSTNPISGAVVAASLGPTYTISTVSNAAGHYTLTLISGVFTVSAVADGYLPNSISNVSISVGLTTTQNIALAPAPLHIISGTVRDGFTGWPLYAHLRLSGSPNNDLWNDPVSGFYSVTLPESTSHTFDTTAWVSGYTTASQNLLVTTDATHDISLTADFAACNAPGYQLVGAGLDQTFESWPPPGWSIVDNISGDSLVWNLDSYYSDTNYTDGSGHAADVNSDVHKDVPYDTELRSPVLNLSTYTSTLLGYKLNYQHYISDSFDVDISVDGGTSWSNLRHFTTNQPLGSLYSTPGATDSISLAAYASQTNVMLRWHYYSAQATPWDWYAEIDEVQIGVSPQCLPSVGGLIVGNTYSSTIATPLANVQVANDSGEFFTTTTTIDPKVDDSFYTLFSPAGAHLLTATKLSFSPVTTTSNILSGSTVRQDFILMPTLPNSIYLPLVLQDF